jgi:methyltransferase
VTALQIMVIVIVVQRISELIISRRNYRWAMERGGVESGQGHYWMFFVLHIGWLVGVIVEAGQNDGNLSDLYLIPLAGYLLAQVVRYWAIATLGKQWNTRIVVIPGMSVVTRGPYRWLRHPNYVAVALELFCVPLMFDAWVTAIAASIVNAVVLLGVRIPAEIKALR